jgi:hypothetical protein
MKNIFNKILMASTVAILAATCVNAIPRGPCDKLPDNVCCEAPKPGPFAFSYAKDMGLACPRDFYFHADFLLAQAQEEGLDYAIENRANSLTQVDGGYISGFSDTQNSWDWQYGFKVGMGFFLAKDAWNGDVEYTWFYSKQNASTNLQGAGYLMPLYLPSTVVPNANGNNQKDASAKWKVSYNTLDVKFSRPYHLSRFLIADPHFGIRAAWIDQDYLARYSGIAWTLPDTANLDEIDMVGRNNYWGVGARFGLDSEWLLGSNFSLFGKFAASLLYGKFHVLQHTTLANANDAEVDHEFYQIEPNMDLALGAAWGRFYSKSKYYVAVKVGYEFHHFWHQNNFRKWWRKDISTAAGQKYAVSETTPRGDLDVGGFDFQIRIDF